MDQVIVALVIFVGTVAFVGGFELGARWVQREEKRNAHRLSERDLVDLWESWPGREL